MKQSPTIRIGDVLHRADRFEIKDELTEYQFAGTYSYAKGIFVSDLKIGSTFGLPKIQRLKTNDFVYCKIMAWEGAFGLVPPKADNCVLSGAFVAYEIDSSRIEPKFLEYLFKVPSHWKQIGSQSTGTNVRRQSLHPMQFEESRVPCPTIAQQQTIVARLDQLADKVRQVNEHLDAAETDADNLLAVQFREAITDAPSRKMSEVAPLVRREQTIELEGNYPELGIRSFGKGTFHKPPLSGSEVGTKRLFRIEPGDLMFSNVFAWEGAIAIAKPEDSGRFGSHRFITCKANPEVTTAEFLRYFFLTETGLVMIGQASPGGAGRNRTLGLEKLMALEVPIPSIDIQREFNSLQTKIAELKNKHAKIREANQALLPATLERVFQ
jgi:type I restriction enzyme, S subunit